MTKVMLVGNPKTGNIEYYTQERLEEEFPKIEWNEDYEIEKRIQN